MLDPTFKDMVSHELMEKETQPLWLLTAFRCFRLKEIWEGCSVVIDKIFLNLQKPSIVVS